MNPDAILRQRIVNLLHGATILVAMVLVTAAVGWLIGGGTGALWAVGGGVLLLLIAPRFSSHLILRSQGARPVRGLLPDVEVVLAELARRAGLARTPRLYYIPARALNAVSVGGPDDSSIAVTDGLLRILTPRELAGVLAHEVAHIRNQDVVLLTMAEVMQRVTRVFAVLGLGFLFFLLPFLLDRFVSVLLVVGALMAAPTVSGLLQLALSRSREFAADLEAARLTGDPDGLASALRKLEAHSISWWQLLFPGHRVPGHDLLRTHPLTEERLRRLAKLRDDRLDPRVARVRINPPVATRLEPRTVTTSFDRIRSFLLG